MVVSSACMIVAVMAQIVISMRRTLGDIVLVADGLIAGLTLLPRGVLRRRAAAEPGRPAAVMRIDGDVDAHAGAQQARRIVLVEGDAHGHALHDLDPVAAGV